MDILILGGGVAGLTSALALTKFAPKGLVPNIQIFEIRPEPATVGGAVNLTPNALRLLDSLGALSIMRERKYGETINAVEVFDIYSGKKIAESNFAGPEGVGLGNPPYKALRITRGDALKGVLAAIEKHSNIKLFCGKKTAKIEETSDFVKLFFDDGSTAKGDILLGCDGIHSVARLKHVEPERKATYSGISNAFGFTPAKDGPQLDVHFECTALNFARRGMLLTSFFEPEHKSVYIGALIEVPEIGSRDGWKAAGSDQAQVKADIKKRFIDDGTALTCISTILDEAEDFFLWPVFTLSKGGKWATDRTMLLGDAAHAMPPQGEATGIVFEDTVLFARCLMRHVELQGSSLKVAFDSYEKIRRARIDTAYDEAQSVLAAVKDAGYWGHWIKMSIVPWYLWWTRAYREKHFVEDVTTSDIGF